jgi:hypothetical protein
MESSERQVSAIPRSKRQIKLKFCLSKSGKPFTTPNGHLPTWTEKVEWHAASAFEPASYRSLISSSTAVVHTLGTLLEGGEYKQSIKTGDAFGTVVSGAKSAFESFNGGNPLRKGSLGSYESVNRDSGECLILLIASFIHKLNHMKFSYLCM